MAAVPCPQCGAAVEFDVATKLKSCSFCGSLLFIDRSGARFYYVADIQVDRRAAESIFRRWTAGPKIAKELESEAHITTFKPLYFPVYLFRRNVARQEKVFLEPAKSTTLPGMHSLSMPAADLNILDRNYDLRGAELLEPDIDLEHYLPQLPGEPKEQALVYLPFWQAEYVFHGRRYTCMIDASSGKVFFHEFPARSSGPYAAVAGVAYGLFFLEGILALLNPLAGIVAMIATAGGVTYVAYYVAKNR